MNPDLERLRAFCAAGDADAATTLHEHARRTSHDADRRAAARVLLATGRWRLDIASARVERHGHECALALDGQPAVLAVARTLLGWESDHALAWVATETLRESVAETGSRAQVPEAFQAQWSHAVNAHPSTPATAVDDVDARLDAAITAATRRHRELDAYCVALEARVEGGFQSEPGERPTELTVCALDGDAIVVRHIGAGGALVWRQGQARALTRAHTLGHQLRDAGLIDRGQLASFPHRHVVTRALGLREGNPETAQLDRVRDVLRPGDTLVLGTRPLWRHIDDAVPTDIFERHASRPTELAEALREHVRQQDPRREVTVLVARLDAVDPAS